ncbi:MAG: ornithine cyclodeaminase family protein [Acidimicrobiales bacterium]
MTIVLDDEAIRTQLAAEDATRWMGEAIDAHHRGDLVAPPRVHADLGDGRLVFTTGHLRRSWFGYRSYDSFPTDAGDQVVVVHDGRSGAARAVAIGTELGRRRVGAIGAVAAEVLASRSATVAAIIGTGFQASTQLWGLTSVRRLRDVRVFSRDPARREGFAAAAKATYGISARAVRSAREAVTDAEIVVLATSSSTPVIDASWLARCAYVTTLGPKQEGRAEFGLDLPGAAAILVTDSIAQIDAYTPPNLLVGTRYHDGLVSLGAIRCGDAALPSPGSISVFFSVGLAGTEVYLLDRLASSRLAS